MAADPLITLARTLMGAAERAARESALEEASTTIGARNLSGEMTVDAQFMTGYDGTNTTMPFMSDISVEGGTDIVVG